MDFKKLLELFAPVILTLGIVIVVDLNNNTFEDYVREMLYLILFMGILNMFYIIKR